MWNMFELHRDQHHMITLRELLFLNLFESQLPLPPDLYPTVDVRMVRLVDSGKIQTSRELTEYHCEIISSIVT
mgnify:CR=1 FL=1